MSVIFSTTTFTNVIKDSFLSSNVSSYISYQYKIQQYCVYSRLAKIWNPRSILSEFTGQDTRTLRNGSEEVKGSLDGRVSRKTENSRWRNDTVRLKSHFELERIDERFVLNIVISTKITVTTTPSFLPPPSSWVWDITILITGEFSIQV